MWPVVCKKAASSCVMSHTVVQPSREAGPAETKIGFVLFFAVERFNTLSVIASCQLCSDCKQTHMQFVL